MNTNDEITVDVSEQESQSTSETPYDDVFRTLLVDCPELVIPLINEAFGEHYDHIGIRQKKYHAECQSTADGSLMIRLFEYDAQIAIEDAVQKRNEVIFTFSHTTVLYLRCNKNTPSRPGWLKAGLRRKPVSVNCSADFLSRIALRI